MLEQIETSTLTDFARENRARFAGMPVEHNPDYHYLAGMPGRFLFQETFQDSSPRLQPLARYQCVLGGANTLPGHQIIDYGMVLERGFTGIHADARQARERFAEEGDPAATDLCDSVVEVCEAVSELAQRFAAEIARLAEGAEETDSTLLQALSPVVARVPAEPARTFQEALQSIYFSFGFFLDGLGRLDKMLWSYYRADLDAGRLTREGARAMLVEFYRQIYVWMAAPAGQVTYGNRTITLGGVDEDGDDITNDLTYLFLEVTEELNLATAPAVYLRVGTKTPPALLARAVEILAKGIGYPSLFNDEVFIPGLHDLGGCSLPDARDYAPTGCGEITIPGRNTCNCAMAQMNVPLILLLALRDGRHPETGEQLGPRTGELADFSTFEQLFAAFKAQFSFFIDRMVERTQIFMEDFHRDGFAMLFSNAVTRDCLARGEKYAGGGARYTFAEVAIHGLPNVIDGLSLLRTQLFGDSPQHTAGNFLAALQANYSGYEALRQQLLRDPRRWGNDNEVADTLAREVFTFVFTEINQHKNMHGGPFLPLGISWLFNQSYREMAATPDGRRSGEPLAAVHSSVHGIDRQGLTALFNSMAKIDWAPAPASVQCGISLHPSMLRTPEDREKFVALLQVQIARRGFSQLLCNVLDNEELAQALLDPENHQHLNVRVSGYNARFIDLPDPVQQEIISRTKQKS